MTFAANAKITMSPIFTDDMILQRDKEVAVFGKANPNTEITVSFDNQTVKAKSDNNGKWLATLKPMKASSENRIMTVSESNGYKLEIKNVLVGEVWLCSGQSNMECPIWGGGTRYRAMNGGLLSQLANYDKIRFFNVSRKMSTKPLETMEIKWSSLCVDEKGTRHLSACAYFFGVQLYQSLGVPVALIDSNWGGTRIETWIPSCGFASRPSLKSILKKLDNLQDDYTAKEREELKKQKQNPTRHQQPTVLYNAMINPFVPYTIRGAIWYQGCSNLGEGNYAELMHALYNGWSNVFKNPELQFYFVQLAPYRYGGSEKSKNKLCISWEQQRKFAKEQPNAGMIITTDVGDLHDIHPYDKQTVGLRLAAMALQHTYKMESLKADFPSICEAKIDGDKVVMKFDNVKKFYSRSSSRKDGDKIRFMEIAGVDGVFKTADVQIKGNKLEAKVKDITEPKSIRFMYAPDAECNLFNEYGLPLDSFKLDLK